MIEWNDRISARISLQEGGSQATTFLAAYICVSHRLAKLGLVTFPFLAQFGAEADLVADGQYRLEGVPGVAGAGSVAPRLLLLA